MMLASEEVLMLLTKPYRPDPRVAMEAKLLERYFRVTIIAWDRERAYPAEELISRGIRVLRIELEQKGGNTISFALKLLSYWILALRKALRLNFRVVHCHDLDTLPLGLLIKTLKRGKVVLVYDAHEIYSEMVRARLPSPLCSLIKLFEVILSTLADYLVVPSVELATFFPVNPGKVIVLPNCPPEVDPHSPTPPITEKFRAFTVVYAGGLTLKSGIVDLLRALAGLRGVRLIVAGLGPLEPLVRRVAKLADNIEFLGYIPNEEVTRLVSKCHLAFVMYRPDDYNSVCSRPNKFIDAISMGVPVLGNKGTAFGKVIERSGCGVVIGFGDVVKMRRVVEELRDNRELLHRLSERAKSLWELERHRILRLRELFVERYKRIASVRS